MLDCAGELLIVSQMWGVQFWDSHSTFLASACCVLQVPATWAVGFWRICLMVSVKSLHGFYMELIGIKIILLFWTLRAWWELIFGFFPKCSDNIFEAAANVTGAGWGVKRRVFYPGHEPTIQAIVNSPSGKHLCIYWKYLDYQLFNMCEKCLSSQHLLLFTLAVASPYFLSYSSFQCSSSVTLNFLSLLFLGCLFPLCHCFLIHFTFLSTSLPCPQFGLIPHSECNQKYVRKVVRVLEFDTCLCCCVISSKICDFSLFFPSLFLFFSVFHLVKAKWGMSCISHCIQHELGACTGVWILAPDRQPRHAIFLFSKHDQKKCFFRVYCIKFHLFKGIC